MLLQHIVLNLSSASTYLGIPETLLRKHLPKQRRFSIAELDALEKANYQTPEWISYRWTGEDYIACLYPPTIGYALALTEAAYPIELSEESLDRTIAFMAEAPFLGALIDVMYFLNSQLLRYKSIESVADVLSSYDCFRLYKIPKSDPNFKQLSNLPPVLR
jgi:hypothetical protein